MMKKIKFIALATLVVTATLGAKRLAVPTKAAHSLPIDRYEAAGAMTAAFRDGVFQAKLSVQRGEAEHLSIGRWNSDQDRAAFIAGYRQSYRQEMALHRQGH